MRENEIATNKSVTVRTNVALTVRQKVIEPLTKKRCDYKVLHAGIRRNLFFRQDGGNMGPAPTAARTVLAFRTPVGGVSIPAGQSRELGVVDVSAYERIRVVAAERAASGTGISIRLTITEPDELVAQLDVLHLTPHAQSTQVYEVPGTTLTVFADAAPGTGNDGLDVLIYGFKE
jgi:hypothetical protein